MHLQNAYLETPFWGLAKILFYSDPNYSGGSTQLFSDPTQNAYWITLVAIIGHLILL